MSPGGAWGHPGLCGTYIHIQQEPHGSDAFFVHKVAHVLCGDDLFTTDRGTTFQPTNGKVHLGQCCLNFEGVLLFRLEAADGKRRAATILEAADARLDPVVRCIRLRRLRTRK